MTLADIAPASSPVRRVGAFEERIAQIVARNMELRAEELRARQAEMDRRHQREVAFDRLAELLHQREIRPRMEVVTRHFENARLEHVKTSTGTVSTAAFARTARFPATTTLTVGVALDPIGQSASLTESLQIIPVLMDYERNDVLPVALDSPDVEQIATWLEQRLERFVEIYLRIEDDPNYQASTQHIDPVCGMRVTEVSAIRLERRGKTHYFCAPGCRDRFEADPSIFGSSGSAPLED